MERSQFQLELVDPSLLGPFERASFNIVTAQLLLGRSELLEAREFALSTPAQANARSEPELNWTLVRSDILAAADHFSEAAQGYFYCSQPNWTNQALCRDQLWLSLTRASQSSLETLRSTGEPDLRGWIDLARVAYLNLGDFTTQAQALAQWRQNYAAHSASRNLPGSLAQLDQMAASAPARIAVLLPLSGALAPAGNAVLEGILSAFYASASRAETPPHLTIYDTEALPLELLTEILRSEGFDGVIGPLERDRVDQLVNNSRLGIPVVALNQLSRPAENAIGIGLAVESEARQIADRAALDGHHTAIIMAPNSAWGGRSANTFATTWQALDQSVAAVLRYAGSADQASLLESALHLDQSNQRRSALQGLLGKQLNFTPRRRSDVDMVFLAASPDQARQITPLMAFFFAEDLPVYATSTIYSGSQNTDLDRDLDDVAFLNYPWVLQPTNPRVTSLPAATASLSQDLKSLQALGVDAYYLMRRFPQVLGYPDAVYHGQTGTLQLQSDGNVDRHMPWATFRAGRVASLDN